MITKWALGTLALVSVLTGAPASVVAAGDDGPTVAKDSVQVTPFTLGVYHKDFDTWSWVPHMAFRVNGPISSGSQLYAEFAIPGATPVKFDCPTSEILAGRWLKVECGGRDVPEEKGTLFTGSV